MSCQGFAEPCGCSLQAMSRCHLSKLEVAGALQQCSLARSGVHSLYSTIYGGKHISTMDDMGSDL